MKTISAASKPQFRFSNLPTWKHRSWKYSLAVLVGLAIITPVLTVKAVTELAADASDKTASVAGSYNEIDQLASPSASTTTQLRKRLEKILGDSADASQSGQKEKAGYVGEVTRISEDAITVKTPKGNQIIPIDDSIAITKRNRPLPVADIAVGNWVIIIGNRVRNGDVSPYLIQVQTTSLEPKEHLVAMGTITSKSKSGIEFTPRGQTDPISLTVGKNTTILDSLNEPTEFKDVPTDVSAVAVAFATDSGWNISSLKILVDMQEFKDSSPEPAAIKATPKAAVKATPTPAPVQ